MGIQKFLFTGYTGYYYKTMRCFLVLPLLATVIVGAPYGAPAPPLTTAKPQPAKIIEQKPELVCVTHYTTIWDTEYKVETVQECKTHYEKQCRLENQRLCQETTREECKTVQDQLCETVYQKVCVDEYKTVLEPYTETECVILYREDCEYQWVVEGNNKVWAPIQSTCKKNPYDECKEVEKTHEKLVAYPVCKDVPEQKCHYVDRKECHQVPDQVCKIEQLQKCVDIPKEVCHVSHKKIPVRVSKNVPKKVCNNHVVKELVGESVAVATVAASPEEVTESSNNIITRRDPSSIEFGDDKEKEVEEERGESTNEKLVFSV